MNKDVSSLSMVARSAVVKRDWATVNECANAILKQSPNSAEGYFLGGMAARAQRNPSAAIDAFSKALELDESRYDAAVELANQLSALRRNAEAAELLDTYTPLLNNSPRYLDLAGTVYTDIGLSARAYPLFKAANKLQPGIDMFEGNLATCAVFLGKIDEAKALYRGLLERQPAHRKNHYQLSRLGKATNTDHVDQMKAILENSNESEARNVPMYFAIAKELEDLGEWEACFGYYKKACDEVRQLMQYRVQDDLDVIDTIINCCDKDWFANDTSVVPSPAKPVANRPSTLEQTPIFIVGLPRTGTTLSERILSSHSHVSSLGETLFLQMGLRTLSEVQSPDPINPEMIRALQRKDMSKLATLYTESVRYRLGTEPYFIEKLPFNFLYAGFIAKAWPQARIVHMVRHPMDACFSMYKQVFTWAYKFSYSLDELGDYYVAYHRLRQHWKATLGDRFVEVEYENLVSDQEPQTRRLLDLLGLPFEEQCLHFERNKAPSTTASSVQVRDKVHTDSVQKWRRFEEQLEPLRAKLERNGIPLDY